MDKLKDDLKWSIRLYSLTLIIPIILSLMNIVVVGILGMHSNYGFLMNFKVIWIDYYITGHFINIVAWRWHLSLLFMSYIFTRMAS